MPEQMDAVRDTELGRLALERIALGAPTCDGEAAAHPATRAVQPAEGLDQHAMALALKQISDGEQQHLVIVDAELEAGRVALARSEGDAVGPRRSRRPGRPRRRWITARV